MSINLAQLWLIKHVSDVWFHLTEDAFHEYKPCPVMAHKVFSDVWFHLTEDAFHEY